MKFLPLLALATACVLPCFAQTYRVQFLTSDNAFLNQAVFTNWDTTGKGDSSAQRANSTPEKLSAGSPFLILKCGETSVYDGMKPAELTEPFIGSKHKKAYEQALKDDPQRVGTFIKVSVEPSKTDPNSVTVTAEYIGKSLLCFSEEKGKTKPLFQTTQWTSSQEVPLGEPTLIYLLKETRGVIDRTRFWGDIPLLGRLFQKPGTSTSVHEYFVTVSLLPEKKS